MTALTTARTDDASSAANAWLSEHHEEISSRASAYFGRWETERREEAVAEVIALIAGVAHRAAASGRLGHLTPFHCVRFAGRHVRTGRRAAGYSTRDVTSDAARIKHRFLVHSLDSDGEYGDVSERPLRDLFADRDGADPAEVARRNIDYAMMLADPALTAKAKATFVFLATTLGSGKQADLAAELMITPGRITQLKGEIAKVLSKYGYHGPLARRPSGTRRS